MKSLLVVASVAALTLVAGCGSSKPPVGEPLAAQACKSSGQTAATLAAEAAAKNSIYGTLSVDEKALANQESQEDAEGGGGSGLGAALSLGDTQSISVITDCTKLGLPVH